MIHYSLNFFEFKVEIVEFKVVETDRIECKADTIKAKRKSWQKKKNAILKGNKSNDSIFSKVNWRQ